MTDQIIQIKAGSTIDWQANWLVDGKAQNLDGFDIFCQIKDTTGAVKIDMTVTKANQTTRKGSYTVSAAATLTNLKPGVYDCDVVYRNIQTAQVEPTETFLVEFVKKVSGTS